MKRYNLSKIMKLAHFLRKTEGYTMSIALKLAWSKAKRDEHYLIIEVRKRNKINRNTLLNSTQIDTYYRSGAYSGD